MFYLYTTHRAIQVQIFRHIEIKIYVSYLFSIKVEKWASLTYDNGQDIIEETGT